MAILENYIVEKFSSQFVTFIEIMNFSISAIIVMIIFTLIFVVLPDVKPLWKPTLLGALVTTVLFILGKFGINFYLQHSAFTTTYGAAGSFVAILLWIYYSCLLLFLGAAFIKAYANETGNPIKVAKNAVRVETTEVEKKEN